MSIVHPTTIGAGQRQVPIAQSDRFCGHSFSFSYQTISIFNLYLALVATIECKLQLQTIPRSPGRSCQNSHKNFRIRANRSWQSRGRLLRDSFTVHSQQLKKCNAFIKHTTNMTESESVFVVFCTFLQYSPSALRDRAIFVRVLFYYSYCNLRERDEVTRVADIQLVMDKGHYKHKVVLSTSVSFLIDCDL